MRTDSTEAEVALKQELILGEGPVWDDREEKLWWVDIMSGRFFVHDPAKDLPDVFEFDEHLGAAVPRDRGGAVLALKTGFALFNFEGEKLTHLSNPEPHLPGNRFNDGKCDPSGRFWAGTMSYDEDHGAGSLYCLNENLTVDVKIRGVTISNGLAWSPDHKRMYYIDTPPGEIYVYDYDDDSSEIQNRRLLKRIPDTEGYPDGMTIDEEGFLWIALYAGGKVIRIDPETGEKVFEVRLPVPKPTSCTFGGSDLDRLYITTAREYLSEEEIEKWPLSGSLFQTDIPFKGFPVDRFAG